VARNAFVLVNDCQHGVPVRGAGERIMPGDNAFFAVVDRAIVCRQKRMVVSREVSGKSNREEGESRDLSPAR
jgi:hypothetical protein